MIVFRAPLPGEEAALTDLCLRSKAVHGYDEDFMAKCRKELSVDLTLVDRWRLVADQDGAAVGYGELSFDGDAAEVAKLFVDPAALGRGIGADLFDRMVEAASARGLSFIRLDADPGAVGFYEKRGARVVGSSPSGSIPGRVLPHMQFDLRAVGR